MRTSIKYFVWIIFLCLAALAVAGANLTAVGRLQGSLANSLAVGYLQNGYLAQANPPPQTPDGGKLVMGGTYRLESGETLAGDLVVMGGVVTLEEDSTVEGDVVILGGTLTADGTIEGEVAVIGGFAAFGSKAVVKKDLSAIGAKVDLEEGATVEGDTNTDLTAPFSFVVPGRFQIPNWEGLPAIPLPREAPAPVMSVSPHPIWDALWWLIKSFIWAALAVMAVLFIPQRTERMADTAVKNPVVAGGMGCFTLLVVPLVLVLLAITICGIPVSLLGAGLLVLAWGVGIIVLGAETGKRLALMLKTDWAQPVSAGVGTFVLTLILNGVGLVVPCIGWLAPLVVGLVGLGAVLLTRFGGQPYPSGSMDLEQPLERIPEASPLLQEEGEKESTNAAGSSQKTQKKPKD